MSELESLAKAANVNARRNGWWDDTTTSGHDFPRLLMMIVGELHEANEENRKFEVWDHAYIIHYGPNHLFHDGSPMIHPDEIRTLSEEKIAELLQRGLIEPYGRMIEMADAFIRLIDTVYMMGSESIEPFRRAILEKMIYNTSRPLGHGKRY